MTAARPSPAMTCTSTRTRYPGPCYDTAAWVVYWVDPARREDRVDFACTHYGGTPIMPMSTVKLAGQGRQVDSGGIILAVV